MIKKDNYVAKLTDEELKKVCETINIESYRAHFKKHISDYNKLSKIRPETLSYEQIISLVVKYKNQNMVYSFINMYIEKILRVIDKDISLLVDSGTEYKEAVSNVLRGSIFKDMLEVYVKLMSSNELGKGQQSKMDIDGVLKQNDHQRLEELLKSIQLKKDVDLSTTKKAHEYDELKEKYEKLQAEMFEYAEEKTKADEEIVSLKKKVETLTIDNNELKNKVKNALSETSVTKSFTFEDDGYFRSLCRVKGDELYRVADIDGGMILDDFVYWNTGFDRLYKHKGKYAEDELAIWKWSVEDRPNYSYGYMNKTYVKKFNPIQVCLLDGCYSEEQLIKALKSGIKLELKFDEVLVCFKIATQFFGALCKTGNFNISNGVAILKEDILSLPFHVLMYSDISVIKHLNDTMIFNKMEIGSPIKVLLMKNVMDIVKKTFVDHIYWNNAKELGIKKVDFQETKRLIDSINTTETISEIAEKCGCDKETARGYYDGFLDKIHDYIHVDDFETNVLKDILRSDEKALSICKDEVKAEWEKDNKALIEAAELQLKSKEKELSDKMSKLKGIEDSIYTNTLELEVLNDQLASREKLARDVENGVQSRIEKAKKDAAEFIVQQAFCGGSVFRGSEKQKTYGGRFIGGSTALSGELKSETFEDVVCSIADNLELAGVGDMFSESMAAYLYAAYRSNTPLLIAGPNGLDIVSAFSAAVGGKTVDVCQCFGEYNQSVIDECFSSKNGFLAIEEPFASGWTNNVLSLLKKTGKYVFLLVPFAEDLAVLPAGIINYSLVLLSELVVMGKAKGGYRFNGFNDGYEEYETKGVADKKHNALLRKFKLMPMAQNNIKLVLGEYHNLAGLMSIGSSERAEDYIYALWPCAEVMDKKDVLKEHIVSSNALNSEAFKELRDILISGEE